MTLHEICQSVSKEAAQFRRETKKQTPAQIYNRAYDIFIVEQIVYLVGECREYYKDDPHIRRIMTKLCAEGRFLSEFLIWASSENSCDVSNADKALETLEDFCIYYEKKEQ